MTADLPATGRRLISTLQRDGALRLTLTDRPVAQPGPGEVVIRIAAAPVNPSDVMTMLAAADPATARRDGDATVLTVPPAAAAARAGRFGQPLAVGLAGAGDVIAVGEGAEAWLGRTVATLTNACGSFGEYLTVPAAACAELPAGVTAAEGADVFCNPLTVLAMVEELRIEGHAAMVHTAAASNLGQMLVRHCRDEGVALVNVVRREEQAALLRAIGATHVCVSTAPTYAEDLRRAIEATGAMFAFDAVGGGDSVGHLLAAFEAAAASRLPFYSSYGSFEDKRVYIYGRLDESPLVLDPGTYGFGLIWQVRNWFMPGTMARLTPDRAAALRARAVAEIATTFASHYAREIPLAALLDPSVLAACARHTTGGKLLVNPTL